MAEFIGKALAKKTLKHTAARNINFESDAQNPYEEEVEVIGRDGRPTGKYKTRKRGLPPGLSHNDQTILKKIRRRAYRMDMSLFNCCGIRIGWSSVIGLVPVAGDALDAFFALVLVRSARKVDGGLPPTLVSRMLFNVALDFALGLVPFLGDIADAVFRANTRNAWLLECYLVEKVNAERIGHVRDSDTGEDYVVKPPAAAHMNPSRNGRSDRSHRPDDLEMGRGPPPSSSRSQNPRSASRNRRS